MYAREGVLIWDLDVICYTTAVTILEAKGKLREIKNMTKQQNKPGWRIQLEQRIDSLRRRLSFIDIIPKCKEEQKYTAHQRKIEYKLRKWYGRTTKENLTRIRTLLKQDLASACEKLRRRKVVNERQRINQLFSNNFKSVYRKFKAEEEINIKKTPSAEQVNSFWKDVWGKETPFNSQADWLKKLEVEYCKHVEPKEYTLTMEIFKKTLARMPNNKAPEADLIITLWIKRLSATHSYLLRILKEVMVGEADIPSWPAIRKTMLIPKNQDTHQPENYRPVALQNNMFKVYTSILKRFLQDHCETNSIITPEQAAANQLLINKEVMDEVRKVRKNMFCVWLDYRKAFDSVSHPWLIKSLQLAKVPPILINAIEKLTRTRAANAYIKTYKENLESGRIDYKCGILQGDALSVILFILQVNPVSFLLEDVEGYQLGNEEIKQNLNHLFFVDDLKLYPLDIDTGKLLLDIITTFTKDVGMSFEEKKCAYICIEDGKRKSLGQTIEINGLRVKELQEEELYTFLGQDEAVGYNGPLNKEKMTEEYKRRVCKIWTSELYSCNKKTAQKYFRSATDNAYHWDIELDKEGN